MKSHEAIDSAQSFYIFQSSPNFFSLRIPYIYEQKTSAKVQSALPGLSQEKEYFQASYLNLWPRRVVTLCLLGMVGQRYPSINLRAGSLNVQARCSLYLKFLQITQVILI